MQFTPHVPKLGQEAIPYFEDASAANIPGHRTGKDIGVLQTEVSQALVSLGASGVYFVEGTYEDGKKKRYGFQVFFSIYGNPARLDIVALPIRSETPTKKRAALAQALYLRRDELRAIYNSRYYSMQNVVLVQYLLGHNKQTVAEAIVSGGHLPMLGSGKANE